MFGISRLLGMVPVSTRNREWADHLLNSNIYDNQETEYYAVDVARALLY